MCHVSALRSHKSLEASHASKSSQKCPNIEMVTLVSTHVSGFTCSSSSSSNSIVVVSSNTSSSSTSSTSSSTSSSSSSSSRSVLVCVSVC